MLLRALTEVMEPLGRLGRSAWVIKAPEIAATAGWRQTESRAAEMSRYTRDTSGVSPLGKN